MRKWRPTVRTRRQEQVQLITGLLQNRTQSSLPQEVVDTVKTIVATGFFPDPPVAIVLDEQPNEKTVFVEIYGGRSRSKHTRLTGATAGNGLQECSYVSVKVHSVSPDQTPPSREPYLEGLNYAMAKIQAAVDTLRAKGFAVTAYRTNGPRVNSVTLRKHFKNEPALVLEVILHA